MGIPGLQEFVPTLDIVARSRVKSRARNPRERASSTGSSQYLAVASPLSMWMRGGSSFSWLKKKNLSPSNRKTVGMFGLAGRRYLQTYAFIRT
jgi:hypothetical protein